MFIIFHIQKYHRAFVILYFGAVGLSQIALDIGVIWCIRVGAKVMMQHLCCLIPVRRVQ
ncbi:hypothetical protein D3C73_1598770 [compost metagenome]